jgi:hypothetical protein
MSKDFATELTPTTMRWLRHGKPEGAEPAECECPGASVAVVGMAHRINANWCSNGVPVQANGRPSLRQHPTSPSLPCPQEPNTWRILFVPGCTKMLLLRCFF